MNEDQFNKVRLHPNPAVRFALHDTIKHCFNSIRELGEKFGATIVYRAEHDLGGAAHRPSERREYIVLYHRWCSAIIRTSGTGNMFLATYRTVDAEFAACKPQWRRVMELLGVQPDPPKAKSKSKSTQKDGGEEGEREPEFEYTFAPGSILDTGHVWHLGIEQAHLIRLADCPEPSYAVKAFITQEMLQVPSVEAFVQAEAASAQAAPRVATSRKRARTSQQSTGDDDAKKR